MIKEERFLNILEYLKENKRVLFADFAKLNNVSIDTVRRDVDSLEKSGLLHKVRGGAVHKNIDIAAQDFDIREIVNRKEKQELAQLITDYVADGETIALNSSTTNMEIAKVLCREYSKLTVLTNDIDIIRILSQNPGISIIFPGGTYDPLENAVFGDKCEEEILNYNANTAIIAVNGISIEKGVTDFRLKQSGLMKAMMKIAAKIVVVADYSKFNRVSCLNICDVGKIDIIISDRKFPKELKQEFEIKGVLVVLPR